MPLNGARSLLRFLTKQEAGLRVVCPPPRKCARPQPSPHHSVAAVKGQKGLGTARSSLCATKPHSASLRPPPQSREAPLGEHPSPHLFTHDSSFSSTLLTPPTTSQALPPSHGHIPVQLLRGHVLLQRPRQLPKSGKDTWQSILPLSSQVSWQSLQYP